MLLLCLQLLRCFKNKEVKEADKPFKNNLLVFMYKGGKMK